MNKNYSSVAGKILIVVSALCAAGVIDPGLALAKQDDISSQASPVITNLRTVRPTILQANPDLEIRKEINRLSREADLSSNLSEKQKLLEEAVELSNKISFSNEICVPIFSPVNINNPKRRTALKLCEVYREEEKWTELELFLKRHGDLIGELEFNHLMGEALFHQGKYAEARVILRRFVPSDKRPVPDTSSVEFGVPFNTFYHTSLLNTEQLRESQLEQIERDFELKVKQTRALVTAPVVDPLESPTWREIESLCLRAVRTSEREKSAKLFEDALKLCDESDEPYSLEHSSKKLFEQFGRRSIPQDVISGHLIQLYSSLQKWDKEQDLYEKYSQTVWKNGVGDYRLAKLLFDQHKYVEARIVLRKVVPELKPKPRKLPKNIRPIFGCGVDSDMFNRYTRMLETCEYQAKGTPTAEINKIKRDRRARMQQALEYRSRLLAKASSNDSN